MGVSGGGPLPPTRERDKDEEMRSVRRPRHYVSARTLGLLRAFFRYSYGRDAFVLRGIGGSRGPVLRIERRRRQRPYDGGDRRRAQASRSGAPRTA
jgi:hypothetical protein